MVKLFQNLVSRIKKRIIRRLERPIDTYEQRIFNNMDRLTKYIQKGDVVLVEGRSEMSRIIKLFSQSHWSHSALYIGNELVKRGSPDREKYLEAFGEDANHLIVEAYAGEGVIVAPLAKYREHNLRVCRPYGIVTKDLRLVMEGVIASIGGTYDNHNLLEIGIMLLQSWLNPLRRRSIKSCLGGCDDFQVICSGSLPRLSRTLAIPSFRPLRGRRKTERTTNETPMAQGSSCVTTPKSCPGISI